MATEDEQGQASQASLAELYEGYSQEGTLFAEAARTREQLHGSLRPDIAGSPVDYLRTDITYHARVGSMWRAYYEDALFAKLVNRSVDFACTDGDWEIQTPQVGDSWIDRAEDPQQRSALEEDLWHAWSTRVNEGVPNVIPGMQEVDRWAVKHLMLSGMFVPHVEWGDFTYGRFTVKMPIRITCHPASMITLARPSGLFDQEEVWLYRPSGVRGMQAPEGQPLHAPVMMFPTTQGLRAKRSGVLAGHIQLPILGQTDAPATECWVVKYQWTPGDLVMSPYQMSGSRVGPGIYPQPPFYALRQHLEIRQKLVRSDLAILDGIIRYLLLWKIGDKDNQPKAGKRDSSGNLTEPGTLTTIRKILSSALNGATGESREVYVPYWVNLEVKTPPLESLMNETKYGASATEVFASFGIFFARSASGSRERMEQINLSNFEEMLRGLQNYVKSFRMVLAKRIVDVNKGKLKDRPTWIWNPVNTKTAAWHKELQELQKFGKISFETLLRQHGLDPDVELRRIATELNLDVDDLAEANVPITYRQTVVDAPKAEIGDLSPGQSAVPGMNDAEPEAPTVRRRRRTRKRVSISPGLQEGRPPA